MENTDHLVKKLEELGFELVVKPTMNVVCIKLKNPENVVKLLTASGWKVNLMDRISSIRVVVMPHVTREILDDFIPDLEKVCKKVGEI